MFLDLENIWPLSFYYDIDSDSSVTELKLLPKLMKIFKETNSFEVTTILDNVTVSCTLFRKL